MNQDNYYHKTHVLREGTTLLYVDVHESDDGQGSLYVVPDLGVFEGDRPKEMKLSEWRELMFDELRFQINHYQVCGSGGIEHLRRAARLVRNAMVHIGKKHPDKKKVLALHGSDYRRFLAYKWLTGKLVRKEYLNMEVFEDSGWIEITF